MTTDTDITPSNSIGDSTGVLEFDRRDVRPMDISAKTKQDLAEAAEWFVSHPNYEWFIREASSQEREEVLHAIERAHGTQNLPPNIAVVSVLLKLTVDNKNIAGDSGILIVPFFIPTEKKGAMIGAYGTFGMLSEIIPLEIYQLISQARKEASLRLKNNLGEKHEFTS